MSFLFFTTTNFSGVYRSFFVIKQQKVEYNREEDAKDSWFLKVPQITIRKIHLLIPQKKIQCNPTAFVNHLNNKWTPVVYNLLSVNWHQRLVGENQSSNNLMRTKDNSRNNRDEVVDEILKCGYIIKNKISGFEHLKPGSHCGGKIFDLIFSF